MYCKFQTMYGKCDYQVTTHADRTQPSVFIEWAEISGMSVTKRWNYVYPIKRHKYCYYHEKIVKGLIARNSRMK